MTQPTPEHLQVTRNARGFALMPILSARVPGEHVTLWESSLASEPAIWLAVSEPRDRNAASRGESVAADVATAHLPLEVAEKLRDQLNWLIDNHYQVRGGDGS